MPKPKDAKQQACAPSSLILACYFAPVRQALVALGVQVGNWKKNDNSKINPLAFGLGIGIAIGTGISVALGNLALGIVFGISIGVALYLNQTEDNNKDK